MLPSLLAERARRTGDELCLIEAESGLVVTNGQLYSGARRLGAGLAALGVGAGDTVATMLPHCIDTYRIWFGLAGLGALEVPVGTRYRGRMLEHIIGDSGARVVIVDDGHAAEVARVLGEHALPHVQAVVVRGEGGPRTIGGTETLRLSEVATDPAGQAEIREPTAQDLAMVLYTSGTTGPSKGVLVPWGQVDATVTGVFPDGTCVPGKVLYGPFPPNHIGGRLFAGMAIRYGIPAVIRDAFSASAYWGDVGRYGCTTTALVSAMVSILLSAPERPGDDENPLRDVLMNPLTPESETFRNRFGVRVCTDYNMTETSIPLHSGWEIEDWRSCGKVRPGPPGYEVRLVDQRDVPVAEGEVGELVCRTQEPWAMNAGYLGRPDETAAAWRDGWFHTGDAFRVDAGGRYYFVDRIKDAIRRRGENVSSFEIEREVLDHPDVAECAAIGVPSELGEQDIKVFVVRRPGSGLTAAALLEHLRARCADFMVPRYVEFLDELPRTEATQKVRKSELRDRENRAAGLPAPDQASAGSTPMDER
jgi:carnitine-CoA ligase